MSHYTYNVQYPHDYVDVGWLHDPIVIILLLILVVLIARK